MNAVRRIFVLLVLGTLAVSVHAQVYRSRQPNRPSIRQLINRLEFHTDQFRNNINVAIEQNQVADMRTGENMSVFMSDFDNALRQFHERFDQRIATSADVRDVINRGALIDRFMSRHTVDTRTENSWSFVRGDLNQLANLYGISWPSVSNYPTYPVRPTYAAGRLTGTYRLDVSASDDTRLAADRALRSLPYYERQQRRDQILRRLEAADEIAIDVRGRTVTLASTRAPQITFDADGRERTETTPSGRTIQSSATLSGNQLIVNVNGDRTTDFSVTFEPMDNGRRLSVTRNVYLEGLSQPVVVHSTYDRIAEVARFDIYNGQPTYPTVGTSGDFIVSSGETVIVELNQSLSSATSREGDRFTATVRLPERFAGATLEGHVSNIQRSGRLTGRSEMTFNFDNLRLRDGRSYRFAGYVTSIRTPDGETMQIDNEGAVREESQTRKTEERTVIGTAIGALIGAIAGGGKGAAIGAIVGAGAGAGSVYAQGRDELDLPRGTEVTIQATGPR
jgi:YMGG-like Gly-zipper